MLTRVPNNLTEKHKDQLLTFPNICLALSGKETKRLPFLFSKVVTLWFTISLLTAILPAVVKN